MTRLITLSPTICQLPASHDKNRRFYRESGLAGIGLYRVRHVFFLLSATAPPCHICHASYAPLHRQSFLYIQLITKVSEVDNIQSIIGNAAIHQYITRDAKFHASVQ